MLKSTHPTGDATKTRKQSGFVDHMLKSTHPTGGCDRQFPSSLLLSVDAKIHASHGGDATAKYSVCSCKKAIVRTNILYFFSSNQIG